MSLKEVDVLELRDRYDYLIKKYVDLATQIAPLLDKFGKYRQELQLISLEFKERGLMADNPEELTKLIEDAIKKRNVDAQKASTSEGHTEPRQDTI